MTPAARAPERNHLLPFAAAVSALAVAALVVTAPASSALPVPPAVTGVELGTAEDFAVLAGSAVTDVPVSVIAGDVGLSPAAGTMVDADFSCDTLDGTLYTVNDEGPACRQDDAGLLTTARSDQSTAYGDAAGRLPTRTYADGDDQLGGDQTLVAGVYRVGHAPTANLVGNLTLDGDESSVWIFQATSDLVFASGASITLTGGAQACNVFWQVGTQATLGTDSDLVGTFMAGSTVVAQTRARIEGRLFADAAVTMDMVTITRPGCEPASPPTGEPSGPPTGEPSGPPTGTPTDDSPTGPSTPPTSDDTPTATAAVPRPDSPAGSDGSGSRSGGPGSGSSSQVREVPSGAVGAGDGSTAAAGGNGLDPALPLTGLLALLVAGGVVTLRADRRA